MISLPPERGYIHVWLIKNILISEENVSNDDNDDLPRSLETQNIFQNIRFKVIHIHVLDIGSMEEKNYHYNILLLCGFL